MGSSAQVAKHADADVGLWLVDVVVRPFGKSQVRERRRGWRREVHVRIVEGEQTDHISVPHAAPGDLSYQEAPKTPVAGPPSVSC